VDIANSLADSFELIQQSQEKLEIDTFFFSQTSLEQVFMYFAQDQPEQILNTVH